MVPVLVMDNWFYVQDGNRVGPVSEEQLKTLHQAGAVEGKTLIWRKGLKEWQQYDVVFPPPPGKKAADLVTEEKKNKAATPPGKPPESAGPPGKPPEKPGATSAEPGKKPTPPPPPPEAYEQQQPKKEPEEPQAPKAQAAPAPPQGHKFSQTSEDAPTKLPKPIKSKGSEERWKSAGPTFSLAAGKRKEEEEEEKAEEQDQKEPTDAATQEPSSDQKPRESETSQKEDTAGEGAKPEPEPESEPEQQERAPEADAKASESPPSSPESPPSAGQDSEPKVTPSLSENQELKPLKVAGEKSNDDIAIDGPVVERAICGECQKPFPVNMMDKFGRKWVCKLCQARLQEKYQQDKDRKDRKRGLFTGTMERILLGLVFFGLLAAVVFSVRGRLSEAFGNMTKPFNIKASLPATDWVSLPPDEWPQLVMVNAGTFAESSPLRGGTSFLLRGADDKVVGVTSSTLLNLDYGVYPPVHPASIPMVLANWKMINPQNTQEMLRFTQTVGDPFSYLDTPVLYLELENPAISDYPVEVLKAQKGPLEEQFVYVVTMQPRGDQFVQTVYSGTAFPSGGMSKSLTIKLPEAVSDAEVPGAPILDSNGHLVGMVVGSSPFEGHMPYEDFEQLSYSSQTGNRPIRRRRDVKLTVTLYGVDLKAFPDTIDL